jgi:hypothetical protein
MFPARIALEFENAQCAQAVALTVGWAFDASRTSGGVTQITCSPRRAARSLTVA